MVSWWILMRKNELLECIHKVFPRNLFSTKVWEHIYQYPIVKIVSINIKKNIKAYLSILAGWSRDQQMVHVSRPTRMLKLKIIVFFLQGRRVVLCNGMSPFKIFNQEFSLSVYRNWERVSICSFSDNWHYNFLVMMK